MNELCKKFRFHFIKYLAPIVFELNDRQRRLLLSVISTFNRRRRRENADFFHFCHLVAQKDDGKICKLLEPLIAEGLAQIVLETNVCHHREMHSKNIDIPTAETLTQSFIDDITLPSAHKTQFAFVYSVTKLASELEQIAGAKDKELMWKNFLNQANGDLMKVFNGKIAVQRFGALIAEAIETSQFEIEIMPFEGKKHDNRGKAEGEKHDNIDANFRVSWRIPFNGKVHRIGISAAPIEVVKRGTVERVDESFKNEQNNKRVKSEHFDKEEAKEKIAQIGQEQEDGFKVVARRRQQTHATKATSMENLHENNNHLLAHGNTPNKVHKADRNTKHSEVITKSTEKNDEQVNVTQHNKVDNKDKFGKQKHGKRRSKKTAQKAAIEVKQNGEKSKIRIENTMKSARLEAEIAKNLESFKAVSPSLEKQKMNEKTSKKTEQVQRKTFNKEKRKRDESSKKVPIDERRINKFKELEQIDSDVDENDSKKGDMQKDLAKTNPEHSISSTYSYPYELFASTSEASRSPPKQNAVMKTSDSPSVDLQDAPAHATDGHGDTSSYVTNQSHRSDDQTTIEYDGSGSDKSDSTGEKQRPGKIDGIKGKSKKSGSKKGFRLNST